MADGGRKRRRFRPNNLILSPQRKKRHDNRQKFYIGNASEDWERQRCFYGESHAQFAAHLQAQHASCLECHIQCDSDSERNALSPIIPTRSEYGQEQHGRHSSCASQVF